ncbi:MAG: hypothetical protein GF349_00495 [Candidatus Magasanikbacteria bacterium]|nr:hypothetical protein [Candidatus Magasanikbacteria bacterium]
MKRILQFTLTEIGSILNNIGLSMFPISLLLVLKVSSTYLCFGMLVIFIPLTGYAIHQRIVATIIATTLSILFFFMIYDKIFMIPPGVLIIAGILLSMIGCKIAGISIVAEKLESENDVSKK